MSGRGAVEDDETAVGGEGTLTTVTFLFTDIEGSTALWEQEPEEMRAALQRHDTLLRTVVERFDGYVFKTVGDAFCVTFDSAPAALGAACEIQQALVGERWPTSTPLRVRVALHTGEAHMSDGDYYGTTVNRCARLLAVARGGQTLLSSETERLVHGALPEKSNLRDVGMHRLRDLPNPVHVFQLVHPGLVPELLEMGDLSDGPKRTASPVARFNPINLYDVPTLPTVVMQAVRVMQDGNAGPRAVEQVVARDPAISAKILRVANSAFFGFSRRVTTITDAIRVLGFNNVQGMIIGVAAFDAFRSEQLNLSDFWTHSIAVATAARFLAPKARCSADEGFTAGILHDIGKLVFVVQAEADYRQVLTLQGDTSMSSLDAERACFEFTHAEVGAMVAERWELPGRYVDGIAHHHDPAAAAGDSRRFCAVLGLADCAAHAVCEGAFSHPMPDEARLALLRDLSLRAPDWEACLEHLGQAHDSIEAFVSSIH